MAGELSDEFADAVCHAVEGVRTSGGADGGIDEQSQFVAESGDRLPLACEVLGRQIVRSAD
ncbi:hypothetical protein ACFWN5_30450 [Streptomyces sp. NPDC058430]|uniref:hypothetical protein n=1 Tax=Streptomyces sp. NPDC058430 TaxID=3346495 RepID=UPI0036554AEB